MSTQLREKQQLLARCTEQEIALRAVHANEATLKHEIADMEAVVEGMARLSCAMPQAPRAGSMAGPTPSACAAEEGALREAQAREALERALVERSRECEELDLRARFKEAALQHQLAECALRERELASYRRQVGSLLTSTADAPNEGAVVAGRILAAARRQGHELAAEPTAELLLAL